MQNKNVGWLLIGIAVFVAVIIFLFSDVTKSVLDNSCPIIQEGHPCPAYSAINNLEYFGIAITGLLVLVGIFLIFSKPEKEMIIKKIEGKKEKRNFDVSELKHEERNVLKIIHESKAIFQAELIEKTGFGKAKITRILDRLEGKGFVERKRRGMTNVVVLKT